MKIVWKDLWNIMDAIDGDIESENMLFRIFLVLLIPVKFIIAILLALIIFLWVFSGFGLFFIIAELDEINKLGIISWAIIIIDALILFGIARDVVLNKN